MADSPPSLEQLLPQIRAAQCRRINGLQGSAPAYVMTQLLASGSTGFDGLTVYVVPTAKDLEEVARELEFYGSGSKVLRFPSLDTLPYFQVSPHRDVQAQRIKTLLALLDPQGPQIVVTSAAALTSFVLAPERLQDKRQRLRPGESCDRDILVQFLIDWGYQRTPLVEDRGTYAVRGGLVDFWGPLDEAPWRVELFGDEIESVRRFDPQKQTSLATLEEAWLVPEP